MSGQNGITVVLAGLGFGAEFLPIYLHHPDVAEVAICDTDSEVLARVGDKYRVERRLSRLDAVLDSREYDAVHLVTPIPLHAQQTLAVLESGKHCACTVPMATTLDDLHRIVAKVRKTNLVYMMMETAVYTREFLFARGLVADEAFGRIQFLRGAHYQDMENWPAYWMGLPPMHYATHAVSPLLALAGTRAVRVHSFGSGRMRPQLSEGYGNPFPVETAIFELADGNLAAEVTRSLFEMARDYTESFAVYGEHMGFEWQQIEQERPVLFRLGAVQPGRGRPIHNRRVEVPDRADLLPPEIARFTRQGVYDESDPHLSFLQGGGHGGSHPHLVHEFVSSIIEGRKPQIDAVTAADWTAPGICAHESAMRGGDGVVIPAFA